MKNQNNLISKSTVATLGNLIKEIESLKKTFGYKVAGLRDRTPIAEALCNRLEKVSEALGFEIQRISKGE